ncbi:MAG: pyridoxal-phosphate dependent enzyme, partial [Halanaeroarchaeum sp.]
VHGGEMSVVEGRLEDAIAEFEDAEHADWHSLAPGESPYRVEGAKTLALEIAEQLGWSTPDAVVHATGSGTGLRGLATGFDQARETGLIADRPALYAAQAEGCAPVVRAHEEGREGVQGWERPDTICGGIEVPNPPVGGRLLAALRDGEGGAVATDDDAILETAVTLAETTGIEATPAGAAAASGARELAERGVLGPEDTVVVVNRSAGTKEADVLRSHLMRRDT